MRSYSIDERVFDKLNANSLYWLGFIVADGYVKSNKDKTNRIKLEVKLDDKEQIYKFIDFVQCNKTPDVFYRTSKNGKTLGVCRVEIFSAHIIGKLREYNIYSPKSDILLDKTDLINSIDFWRGYIDGDGSWSLNKTRGKTYYRLQLCSCNQDLLAKFITFAEQYIGKIRPKISSIPQENTKIIRINGKQAKILFDILYYKGCLCLTRKNCY